MDFLSYTPPCIVWGSSDWPCLTPGTSHQYMKSHYINPTKPHFFCGYTTSISGLIGRSWTPRRPGVHRSPSESWQDLKLWGEGAEAGDATLQIMGLGRRDLQKKIHGPWAKCRNFGDLDRNIEEFHGNHCNHQEMIPFHPMNDPFPDKKHGPTLGGCTGFQC